MRLVHEGLSTNAISLDPGIYTVSARLPGGRQLVETLEVRGGDTSTQVDLTPELEALTWRPRHATVPSLAAEILPERSALPPEWSLRFLRWGGRPSRTMPDRPASLEGITSQQGLLRMTILVPLAAVVFVQIARPAEVPLNVALAGGAGRGFGGAVIGRCMLTIEERSSLLYVAALPYGERAERAAQFLATGEDQQAASLLIRGREAENLLYEKYDDPVGAMIGGYVLLRLGELERTHNWVDNLARSPKFEWSPDGAVIAGEKAAMLGNHSLALNYFLKAGKRGLPVFTDGFSILVSRLRQYQSNAHIQAQFNGDELSKAKALSARLEKWSPFVDFSALTLTFRAAALAQPAESQHPVAVGDDFIGFDVDPKGSLRATQQAPA